MTATRTSVVWAGLWAVAVILTVFMVFVVSDTGDVRISFAGKSGVLPLAVVLMATMSAGIAVTLILGTARLTQLRPLPRRRPAMRDRPGAPAGSESAWESEGGRVREDLAER